jgi:hypothetical protein
MQKTTKKLIVAVLMFSMVTMYGTMPIAQAAGLDSVKDTISDSDSEANDVTHTIVFDMANELAAAEVVTVTFNANFDLTGADATSVTCPTNSTAGLVGQVVTCTVDGGQTLSSTTPLTIIVASTTNPTIGFYDVTVSTNNSIKAESTEALVYIIDSVVMQAHVDATLTFGVVAVNALVDVNGTPTTIGSTATTIPFGDLTVDTPAIIGQELQVTTNAGGGFTVTVQQSGDLVSAAGDDINAAATGYAVWTPPAGTLGSDTTYGKMGFTTEDTSLNTFEAGANAYRGFDGTTPVPVMYNDGPADGSTIHQGSTEVAYQVEVDALQEAGDYETTLTYVCTPTF